jgi:hypothetical protein
MDEAARGSKASHGTLNRGRESPRGSVAHRFDNMPGALRDSLGERGQRGRGALGGDSPRMQSAAAGGI